MCSLVYGVQTCALPISEGLRGHPGSWNRHMRRFPGSGAAGWRGRAMLAVGKTGGHHMRRCTGLLAGIFLLFIAGLAVAQTDRAQIGRASWRDRAVQDV